MALRLTILLALLSSAQVGFSESNEDNSTEVADRYFWFTRPRQRKGECTSANQERGKCLPIESCPILADRVRHLPPNDIRQELEQYKEPCYSWFLFCCPDRLWSTTEAPWQWTDPSTKTTSAPWTVWTKKSTISTQKYYSPTTFRPIKPTTTEKEARYENENSGYPSRTKHRNRHLLPEKQCGNEMSDKILGGDVAALDEHPWVALLRMRLQKRTSYVCGGTLITSRYILTAAHCIKGQNIPAGATIDQVRLGEHNLNTELDCDSTGECIPPPVDVDVEKISIHPEFTPYDQGTFNDIALLRLKRDVKFSRYVMPICLPLDDVLNSNYSGKLLTAVGWGKTMNARTKTRNELKRKVDLPIVPYEECAPKYRARDVYIRDTQMCAGGVEGKDTCQGDSGGPLMSIDVVGSQPRWHLVGIVSTGPVLCGEEDNPALYTVVAKYITWILDNIYE